MPWTSSSPSLNMVLTLRDKKRNGGTEGDEFESILNTWGSDQR